jgi:hypothetical protein
MPSLPDLLARPDVKAQVIDGCCVLIEREVASKRGLSGVAVKAGFAVVTRVKPGFIREVVTTLLPDFAAALDPFYQQSQIDCGTGGSEALTEDFERRVTSDPTRTAEALLGVTDQRIGGARPAVQRAYATLRPNARDHVEAAIPGLLATIRPFL